MLRDRLIDDASSKYFVGQVISYECSKHFSSTGNVSIGTNSPTNSLQIEKGTQNGDIKLNGGRLVAGNASDELIAGQYRSN